MPSPRATRTAAVCAVILDDTGRVLLQRRADNGLWVLPGGGVEVGESASQAIVREVREETGLLIQVRRLVGVYSNPEQTTITYPDGNTVAYVALCFECGVIEDGEPGPDAADGEAGEGGETLETNWFDPHDHGPEALPANFPEKHRVRLEHALIGNAAAFIR